MITDMAATDFNDLAAGAGIDVVRAQLLAALSVAPAAGVSPPAQETLMPSEGWEMALMRDDRHRVRAVMTNIYQILTHHADWRGVIGYCEFSYRVMKRRLPPFDVAPAVGEWSDVDTDRVRLWLGQYYGLTAKNTDVLDAVNLVANDNAFHPVRDYLDALRWDGRPRVRGWLGRYCGADTTPYTEAAGTKWLVGAVARVMQPPVKMDCMLILEGEQGLGKSTVFRILGGEWFMDTNFAMGDKDGFQQLQGVWITELAELDSLNKAETTRAKQFLGAMTDRYRPSYARLARDFPRQCVFGGTTNQSVYLRDSTGNRRYWPVEVHRLRLAELEADRDQLWAEALHLYKQGVRWWPDQDELHLFETQQEARYDADVWEEIIQRWLDEPDRRAVQSFTSADILIGALKLDEGAVDRAKQGRIGPIMKRIGWQRKRVAVAGVQAWRFVRPSAAVSGPVVVELHQNSAENDECPF